MRCCFLHDILFCFCYIRDARYYQHDIGIGRYCQKNVYSRLNKEAAASLDSALVLSTTIIFLCLFILLNEENVYLHLVGKILC